MKKIFVFLFNGFSDWEISYVTPEVYKSKDFELIYFSKDGQFVTSMGGLQIKPEKSLTEIAVDEVDMLILPGGTAWEKQENNVINKLVKEVISRNKSLAAICAATAYLGQIGLLNDVKHTSNDLNYLKAVAPNYNGEKYYEKALSVSDNNLITASGIAAIEFAKEIFKQIKLYDDDSNEKWYQLFKNGIWSE